MLTIPVYELAAAAVLIIAAAVGGTWYVAWHGERAENDRDYWYDEGYADGHNYALAVAEQHLAELERNGMPTIIITPGDARLPTAGERAAMYGALGPDAEPADEPADAWLHNSLQSLYRWSAEQQAKSARALWRVRNSAPRELAAAQQMLELEAPAPVSGELLHYCESSA